MQGENLQGAKKKQCVVAAKKAKPTKAASESKDPQSVAAKVSLFHNNNQEIRVTLLGFS